MVLRAVLPFVGVRVKHPARANGDGGGGDGDDGDGHDGGS